MNELPDDLVDLIWNALRDVCCSTGREAKRIVIVNKQDIEKAVKLIRDENR